MKSEQQRKETERIPAAVRALFLITAVFLAGFNFFLIFRDYRQNQAREVPSVILRNAVIQQLTAVVPFSLTCLYCVLYEVSSLDKNFLKWFSDFFTFLGFPSTVLHMVNLLMHLTKWSLVGPSDNASMVVFPVLFESLQPQAEGTQAFNLQHLGISMASFTVVMNFLLMTVMMRVYPGLLAVFDAFFPIFMFTLLFSGVALDRFALMETSRITTEDYQFIISLALQSFIVDVVLLMLSFYGKKQFLAAIDNEVPAVTKVLEVSEKSSESQKVTTDDKEFIIEGGEVTLRTVSPIEVKPFDV